MIHPKYGIQCPEGSLSHGDMRLETLIPLFLAKATELVALSISELAKTTDPEFIFSDGMRDASNHVSSLIYIRDGMKDDDYFNMEDPHEDIDQLMEILCDFGPEGTHFGSHEGDGADYGWWDNGDDPINPDPYSKLCWGCRSDCSGDEFGKALGCPNCNPGCESIFCSVACSTDHICTVPDEHGGEG